MAEFGWFSKKKLRVCSLGYISLVYTKIGGFLKLGGTILAVPIVRTVVYWGLNWGPLILGNYHMPIPLRIGLRV